MKRFSSTLRRCIQPIPAVDKALSKDGVALTQDLAEKSGRNAERAKGVLY
jgi:hypothetical protein